MHHPPIHIHTHMDKPAQHTPSCRFISIVIFSNRVWIWISIEKSLVCVKIAHLQLKFRLHWRIYTTIGTNNNLLVCSILVLLLFLLRPFHSLCLSLSHPLRQLSIHYPPTASPHPFIHPSPSIPFHHNVLLLRCVATSPTSFATSFSARDCDNCRPIFAIGLKKGIYSFFSRNHRTTPQKCIKRIFAKRNGNNVLENGLCAHSACPSTWIHLKAESERNKKWNWNAHTLTHSHHEL